jgi:hypothetical protein
VTAGEEGEVRVWSRNGNLRSTLAQTGKPVRHTAIAPMTWFCIEIKSVRRAGIYHMGLRW